MHLCALCGCFTTAAPVLVWAVQGAITMAIFGSGMNKEYAFFGYEGDFVRCAVAFSSRRLYCTGLSIVRQRIVPWVLPTAQHLVLLQLLADMYALGLLRTAVVCNSFASLVRFFFALVRLISACALPSWNRSPRPHPCVSAPPSRLPSCRAFLAPPLSPPPSGRRGWRCLCRRPWRAGRSCRARVATAGGTGPSKGRPRAHVGRDARWGRVAWCGRVRVVQ